MPKLEVLEGLSLPMERDVANQEGVEKRQAEHFHLSTSWPAGRRRKPILPWSAFEGNETSDSRAPVTHLDRLNYLEIEFRLM